MPDDMRLSVIIPTYRRRASVQRLLLALCSQTFPLQNVEVIVAIDGSEDGTAEMVQAFQAPYSLRCLWQPNRGRATACNTGINAATGELLILLDDDMEPVPHFLAAHHNAHLHTPGNGVLGPVPIAIDSHKHSAVARYTAFKFDEHLQARAHSAHPIGLTDFYTGNFSIRRDLLSRAGLFDEQFIIYGNEDLELYCRLQHSGIAIDYCPEAIAMQSYTKDPATWARDNIAEGRTSVLLAGKHPGTFGQLILGTYETGLLPRRLIRSALLSWARRSPANVERLISIVRWLDKRRLPRFDKLYYAIEDLFYWYGVQQALQDLRHEEAFSQFARLWQQHYGRNNLPTELQPVSRHLTALREGAK